MRVNGIKRAEKWTRFVLLSPKGGSGGGGGVRSSTRVRALSLRGVQRAVTTANQPSPPFICRRIFALFNHLWMINPFRHVFSSLHSPCTIYYVQRKLCAFYCTSHLLRPIQPSHLNPTCRKCHVFSNTDGSNIITYYYRNKVVRYRLS